MCRYTKQVYLCEEPIDDVGQVCRHTVAYIEVRCRTAQDTGDDCKPETPATYSEDKHRCHDRPGCCERCICSALRVWARYRRDHLRGGYNRRSEELGARAEEIYEQHRNACGTIDQRTLDVLVEEVPEDFGVSVEEDRNGNWKW